MGKYRKLGAAMVGTVFAGVAAFTGFEIPLGEADVVNVVVALLTAAGVWAVPNDPA